MEVLDIIKFKESFNQVVSAALKANNLVTIPNAENVILWPEFGAIIRVVGEEGDYDSIAIESEVHNLYAYWAPDYAPVFITCEEEDFIKFYNLVCASE